MNRYLVSAFLVAAIVQGFSFVSAKVRKCNKSFDCKKTECCVQLTNKNIRVCRRRPTNGSYCVAFLGPKHNKHCPCAAGLRCQRRLEDNLTNHNQYFCAPIHPPEKEKKVVEHVG